MKEKKQYNLAEAIKGFYKTEPLKIDLASSVANKVLVKPKEISSVLDKLSYMFVTVLIIVAAIYSFSFFKEMSGLSVLITMIALISYFSLSFKEYSLMSKRLS